MKLNMWIALPLLIGLAAPTSAWAANDCCWDWNGNQDGVGDGLNGNEPGFIGGSPNGFAPCTDAAANGGGGQLNCFSRDKRQAFLPNYFCFIGSNDPGGAAPPAGTGYACFEKGGPLQFWYDLINQTSVPPGAPGLTFEGGNIIPSLSNIGVMVMMGLMVLCGAWMIRKNRAAPFAG